MKIEETRIPTMGMGRWYALVEDGHKYEGYEHVGSELWAVDELGRKLQIFLVEDDNVCEKLARRHEGDQQWEERWDKAMNFSGKWIDTAMEEEYEAMYKELAEKTAEVIMELEKMAANW